MKKIILISFMGLFLLAGSGFAADRGRYESSQHKFRSQFNDNEWREHQARHESYLRARHPEYFLYRDDRYNNRYRRDRYRDNDSLRYGREYKYDWMDDSHGYDRDEDDYDWQEDSDRGDWDRDEDNSDNWNESR
jgi:hypothetical protein